MGRAAAVVLGLGGGINCTGLRGIWALTGWNTLAVLKRNMTYYSNTGDSPRTRPTLKTHYSHEYVNNSAVSSSEPAPLAPHRTMFPPCAPLPSFSRCTAVLLPLPPASVKDGGESSVVAFRQNRLSEKWRQGCKLRFPSLHAAVQSLRQPFFLPLSLFFRLILLPTARVPSFRGKGGPVFAV